MLGFILMRNTLAGRNFSVKMKRGGRARGERFEGRRENGDTE